MFKNVGSAYGLVFPPGNLLRHVDNKINKTCGGNISEPKPNPCQTMNSTDSLSENSLMNVISNLAVIFIKMTPKAPPKKLEHYLRNDSSLQNGSLSILWQYTVTNSFELDIRSFRDAKAPPC